MFSPNPQPAQPRSTIASRLVGSGAASSSSSATAPSSSFTKRTAPPNGNYYTTGTATPTPATSGTSNSATSTAAAATPATLRLPYSPPANCRFADEQPSFHLKSADDCAQSFFRVNYQKTRNEDTFLKQLHPRHFLQCHDTVRNVPVLATPLFAESLGGLWVPSAKEWTRVLEAHPVLAKNLSEHGLQHVPIDTGGVPSAQQPQQPAQPTAAHVPLPSSEQPRYPALDVVTTTSTAAAPTPVLATTAASPSSHMGDAAAIDTLRALDGWYARPADEWVEVLARGAVDANARHQEQQRQQQQQQQQPPSQHRVTPPPATDAANDILVPATPPSKPSRPAAASPMRVPSGKRPAPAPATANVVADPEPQQDEEPEDCDADAAPLPPPPTTPKRSRTKPGAPQRKRKPATAVTATATAPAAAEAVTPPPPKPAKGRIKGPGVSKAAKAAAAAATSATAATTDDNTLTTAAPPDRHREPTVDGRYQLLRSAQYFLRGALAGNATVLEQLRSMQADAARVNPRMFEYTSDSQVERALEFRTVLAPFILSLADPAQTDPMRLLIGYVDPQGQRHGAGYVPQQQQQQP